MEFSHIPVLFNETIDSLNIKPDGVYVDCTAGGGGHSRAIAEKLTTGRLISIDRDPDAIKVLNCYAIVHHIDYIILLFTKKIKCFYRFFNDKRRTFTGNFYRNFQIVFVQ